MTRRYRKITERTRVAEALRASEEQYRLLFEASPYPMFIYDHETLAYLAVNDAAIAQYGYTREEFLAMRIPDIRPPEEIPTLLSYLAANTRRGARWSSVWRHRTKDGRLIEVETASHPMTFNGRPARLIFVQNATERARSHAALAASEQRFRALVEKSSDALALIDAEGRITYAGPSTERILGYAMDEIIGQYGREFIHPDDQATATAAMAATLASPGASATTQYRIRRKDGSWLWMEGTGTNLLHDPAVRAIVGNYRDITERKMADEALRRQNFYLSALHETSLGLLNHLDLDSLLETIVARAGELLGTPDGYIYWYEHGDPNRAVQIGSGTGRSRPDTPVKPGEGLIGAVMASGEPLVVNDYQRWPGRVAVGNGARLHAAVAVPVNSRSGTIGVLSLAHLSPDRIFMDEEVALLTQFAQLAAVALDNAQLYRAAQEEVRERREAEGALRESEARYRVMFEDNPLPMWVFDAETLAFLAVNDAAVAHYGYARDEFLAMTLPDIRPEAERPALIALLRRQTEMLGTVDISLHRTKDGTIIDTEVRLHRMTFDDRSAYLALVNDITERTRAEEQLRHSAYYDSITALPNRQFFVERLTAALARAKRRPEERFAVLFLDLDRFKVVNDSLGHERGDRFLAHIARRLRAALPPRGVVARFGGDEFAILLEDACEVADAVIVAEGVLAALQAPIRLRGHELTTTASIGIVMSCPGYAAEQLLRDADIAMYRAKAAGGGRLTVFDAAMHAAVAHRMTLEVDLKRALARGEFRLLFQPIVSLATRRVTGFEALVRWAHPQLGDVPPAEFIPIAEETGMIVPIGRWILRAACDQLRAWQETIPTADALTISVNVSGKQFAHPDFVRQVEQILAETGVAPAAVHLEITERALVDHTGAATEVLARLHALGLRIDLDDFGIGYSSLSYLRRFPIDTVKIDRSFVQHVPDDAHDRTLVQAIVTLAHGLGITVIAEGIESAAHAAHLREMRCDYGQGHHFARPRDAAGAAASLTDTTERRSVA